MGLDLVNFVNHHSDVSARLEEYVDSDSYIEVLNLF